MSWPTVATSLDDFEDLLAVHVPFCPTFLRQQALRQALREFFEETRSWRSTIEEQPVFPEDPWIDANALARHVSVHALALAVEDVFLNSDKTSLRRLDIEDMDRRCSGWYAETGTEPTGFMVYADRRVRIYPALEDDADAVDLDVELILTCDMEITTLPDFVFQYHVDAIVNGAAWRLLSQPGMPWTDPTRAGMFMSTCQAETADAKNERALRAVTAANERTRRRFLRG